MERLGKWFCFAFGLSFAILEVDTINRNGDVIFGRFKFNNDAE